MTVTRLSQSRTFLIERDELIYFAILRSGENGRELQKGDKYDWKQDGDTYTLLINNPVLEDDGTYILVVKEVDAKTGGYLTVKKRDPEYWFVRPLKEQELGYTDRPYSMAVEMSEPGVNLKWLKNNAPIVWSEVNCIKKDEGKTYLCVDLGLTGDIFQAASVPFTSRTVWRTTPATTAPSSWSLSRTERRIRQTAGFRSESETDI